MHLKWFVLLVPRLEGAGSIPYGLKFLPICRFFIGIDGPGQDMYWRWDVVKGICFTRARRYNCFRFPSFLFLSCVAGGGTSCCCFSPLRASVRGRERQRCRFACPRRNNATHAAHGVPKRGQWSPTPPPPQCSNDI
jgi:hypothetical protein